VRCHYSEECPLTRFHHCTSPAKCTVHTASLSDAGVRLSVRFVDSRGDHRSRWMPNTFAHCARSCALLVFLVTAVVEFPVGQTRQFLDAPVVRSQIVVRWNASSTTMQYALDADPIFRNINQDTLFLAKRGSFVAYPRLNPLVVQASASATAVADPGFTAVGKLTDAISSVGSSVAPAALASNINDPRIAATAANGPCSDSRLRYSKSCPTLVWT
jgi:hypothetical protein